MAQVSQDIEARIDHYLDYLSDEWADIPALASEWSQLSSFERLDFVLEWPIKEDYLLQLRDYAEREFLTPAQRTRYQELLKLVAQHRPTLEKLLADYAQTADLPDRSLPA